MSAAQMPASQPAFVSVVGEGVRFEAWAEGENHVSADSWEMESARCNRALLRRESQFYRRASA